MIKFPSVEQFRTVIHNVKHKAQYVSGGGDTEVILDPARHLPTIEFEGTVKLHGTNAGIVFDGTNITFQSRERVLSTTADNAGFYAWGQANIEELNGVFGQIISLLTHRSDGLEVETLAIFGEWCGPGVQSGVAISQIAHKMFVVFAVKVNDEWLDLDVFSKNLEYDTLRMYWINEFPTWNITIDFENPGFSQNRLVELTEAVEAECPVGKAFSVSGIGEGIVWKPTAPEWNSSKYWFKVKGEKHQSSKVKTLAPVDIEALKAVNDFITYAVTESRLEQGLNNLINEQQKAFEMSSIGDFIRWVNGDIFKEENDTIESNGFDRKKLGGPIANAARKWYVTRLNSGK